MKKKIIVLAMALILMPVLSNASTAASAGKSGGSATAASVSTGTIVAASVGVAVVGAIALSNGGSGSSSSTSNVGELTDDGYDAIADALTSFSETEVAQLKAVLENADTSEVAAVLDAIAAASAAGLTAADIQEAATEAGIRRPPAGTNAGNAYDALVAAFQAYATVNPAGATSLGQMITTMDDTKLVKFVALITNNKVNGSYAALAQTFKKDVADIVAEVSAATGETVVVGSNHGTTTNHTPATHH